MRYSFRVTAFRTGRGNPRDFSDLAHMADNTVKPYFINKKAFKLIFLGVKSPLNFALSSEGLETYSPCLRYPLPCPCGASWCRGACAAARRSPPGYRRGAGADSVDVKEAECCGHDHHVPALGATALRLGVGGLGLG